MYMSADVLYRNVCQKTRFESRSAPNEPTKLTSHIESQPPRGNECRPYNITNSSVSSVPSASLSVPSNRPVMLRSRIARDVVASTTIS